MKSSDIVQLVVGLLVAILVIAAVRYVSLGGA